MEDKNSNQTLSAQTKTSDINKEKEKSEVVKVALDLGYVIIEEKEYKVYQ
jgi:hypothetical protein